MGANALIAGIVCLTGPETTNQPTQELVVQKDSPKGRVKESALYDDKEALFVSTVWYVEYITRWDAGVSSEDARILRLNVTGFSLVDDALKKHLS